MRIPKSFLATVTRVQPSDADELTAFRERMFGPGSRQVDQERLGWLFVRNPCADPATPGIWVCRREGHIVGQQAEIPFDLVVDGKAQRAAWAVDLMVDEAWRLRGVGPSLIARQLEGHMVVGALNLSDKGFAAYQRTGWTDLGIVPVYVRPLDLRRVQQTEGAGALPSAVRAMVPMAGPVLRGADHAAAAAAKLLTGTDLVEVPQLDDRVDAVWASTLPHYPVLARRDLATLAWRIDQRPDRDRLHRYVLERHGRPLGYVVLRPTARFDTTAMAVVDYLAPPRWVAPLLLAAGQAAHRQGAAVLMVKTRNEQADRWLRAAGFVRREHGNDPPVRLMVHCADELAGTPLVERLGDPANWFVTAADSDLEPATSSGSASDVTGAGS